MPTFMIKDNDRIVPIEARTREEAIMKFMQLKKSREMFRVTDPKLKPGTIHKVRRMI